MIKYNKAYKFRLLPNSEQEIMFAKIFGCARFMWNKITQVTPNSSKDLGLDYAMNGFYVDSTGETANYLRYHREAEAKLHKLSQAVSRKQKGSINRNKARLKLAKWHERISNMRKDFMHKLSYNLATMP